MIESNSAHGMDMKRKYLVRAIILPIFPIVGLLFLPPTVAPVLTTPHWVAVFGGLPYLTLVPLLIGTVRYSSDDFRRRAQKMVLVAHFLVIALFVAYVGRNGGSALMLIFRAAIMGISCVAIDVVYMIFVSASMPDRIRIGEGRGDGF
jgi:hypothetical protein